MGIDNKSNELYRQWFSIADADCDGRLTGGDAVAFFVRSGLDRGTLAKVWSLADNRRQGFLDVNGFIKAMEFISLAQNGMEVTQEEHARSESFSIPSMQGLSAEGSDNPFASQGGGAPQLTSQSINQQMGRQPVRQPNNDLQPKSPKASMFSSKKAPLSTSQCTSITDALQKVYFTKVKPLEESYKFGSFFSECLNASDFNAKPQILLLGQYSTGKTTFIKHLLGREYPGCHIGPEPTTDRFVVVMGGEERVTPGQTVAVQPDKPYQGLQHFGTGFLGRFQASSCPCKLLEEISIIDTPGILSGEKQRVERQYDFIEVTRWFASRCDLILLLFDPYKLDISDEFKAAINSLKGHDDKVRVVLNKADQVDAQQLMRVYGALMWSLGKVFKSPEVCKVYIGSFNAGKAIREDVNPLGKLLFAKEQEDLLEDLYEIPQRSTDRKVNEFVKRVRAARIHCLLVGHLKKQMPTFGKEKKQEKMLQNIEDEFRKVQKEFHLPAGDFPNPARFVDIMRSFDISKFPKFEKKHQRILDEVLHTDIPNLIKQFENPGF